MTAVRFAGIRVLVAAAAVACVLTGCKDSQKQDPPPPTSRPLHFDPTHEYTLAEWWTNGDELLNLRRNYSYAIYLDNNRYKDPIERGRWGVLTYAALQFEPYSLNPSIERITLDKDSAGELILAIPGLTPMAPLEDPPQVLEDFLIGEWFGDDFSVLLRTDLRYEFQRRRNVPVGSAALGAHQGAWELVEDKLILRPDAAGLETILLDTELRNNTIAIEGMTKQ